MCYDWQDSSCAIRISSVEHVPEGTYGGQKIPEEEEPPSNEGGVEESLDRSGQDNECYQEQSTILVDADDDIMSSDSVDEPEETQSIFLCSQCNTTFEFFQDCELHMKTVGMLSWLY